jgi:hypothetical protein
VLWFATQGGAAYWAGGRFAAIPRLRTHYVPASLRSAGQHQLLWFGTQTGMYAWDDSIVASVGNEDGLVAARRACGIDRPQQESLDQAPSARSPGWTGAGLKTSRRARC